MSERKEYMNLAWEIATKLSVISDETRNEIFGYSDVGRIIRNNTPDAVNFKMIQYEKKLGEEKINVGDIVQCNYLSQGVVTSIICDVEKSEEYNVLFTDGVSESYTRDKLQKTGKTVDVLKTLRELILGWNARFKVGGDKEMDIEKVKKEYLNTLSELQNEMLLLQSRIKKAKNQLIIVKTEEDLEQFRKENDLEDGLKHISLFE